MHGFRLDQVDDALDRFIRQCEGRGAPRARVMTGKGTGAVQKAAITYLKRAGYQWEHERGKDGVRNEGVLVVFIA